MEYLKVVVPGRSTQDIDVLINRRRRGKAGDILAVESGYVLVSIDLPLSEEKVVALWDTTPEQPCVTEIGLEEGGSKFRDDAEVQEDF